MMSSPIIDRITNPSVQTKERETPFGVHFSNCIMAYINLKIESHLESSFLKDRGKIHFEYFFSKL